MSDTMNTGGRRPQLRHQDTDMIPPVLLRAMAILALSALALTTYAVLTGREPSGRPPAGEPLIAREIVLDGSVNGSVRVLDPTGTELLAGNDETGGFSSVMWRAMRRERMQHGVDPMLPLVLSRHDGGRVIVTDPVTGWRVELGGFGADNVAEFARLLD